MKLSRRTLIGSLFAPAIIRTPGLLMPIRPKPVVFMSSPGITDFSAAAGFVYDMRAPIWYVDVYKNDGSVLWLDGLRLKLGEKR